MLHYENKVEMLKTENSNYFLYKEVWNFSVIGVLLVCSYGNTQVNVWGIGEGGETTTRTTTISPHPTILNFQRVKTGMGPIVPFLIYVLVPMCKFSLGHLVFY